MTNSTDVEKRLCYGLHRDSAFNKTLPLTNLRATDQGENVAVSPLAVSMSLVCLDKTLILRSDVQLLSLPEINWDLL